MCCQFEIWVLLCLKIYKVIHEVHAIFLKAKMFMLNEVLKFGLCGTSYGFAVGINMYDIVA